MKLKYLKIDERHSVSKSAADYLSDNDKYKSNYSGLSNLSSNYMTEETFVHANFEKELDNEYFKQKKFNEAIDCYSRSIALSPAVAAYINRAMAYLKVKRSPLSPTDGTDCWLHALKELVSESGCAAKDLVALNFEKTNTYDMLSTSEKLRLLVFLCDETLDTLQVRDWMEEENLKFSEKKKEAKDKLHDARQKAKLSKTKLQDEVAKAIIAKKGAPLSISEHDALCSQMKAESELAHAEVLVTMGLVPKDEDTPDSVRIEPVITDSKGHSYWTLKGCSKFEFVRQELQGRDEAKASEKWFSYEDHKDIQLIKEYQAFSRVEKKKRKTKAPKMENGNSNPSSTTIKANDSPL